MHEIRIPKVGMSTIEVDVTHVHVQVGQSVRPGDPVAEVDTEKVEMTVHADVAGVVLSVEMTEGNTYEVGDIVCTVEVSR